MLSISFLVLPGILSIEDTLESLGDHVKITMVCAVKSAEFCCLNYAAN